MPHRPVQLTRFGRHQYSGRYRCATGLPVPLDSREIELVFPRASIQRIGTAPAIECVMQPMACHPNVMYAIP